MKLGYLSMLATIGIATLGRSVLAVPTSGNSYTEEFGSGNAGWRQAVSGNFVNTASTGGVNGDSDSYATYTGADGNGSNFTSFSNKVLFRADSNASGGNFTGNWIDAGVTSVSFWLRQNSGQTMPFSVRIPTTDGFPAVVISPDNDTTAASGVWTLFNFTVSSSNPNATAPEGGTYGDILKNVGNFQVFVPSSTATGPIEFDLDKATIVTPEPASIGVALVGGGLLLLRRRRAVLA